MTSVANCVSTESSPNAMPDPCRCEFHFADGRRCTLRRWEAHPALCISHARTQTGSGFGAEPMQQKNAPGSEPAPEQSFAIDLAPLSGEFTTAAEVNRALGKVFLLLAQNRIPRRNAVALGYIAQLLLQTLPRVKEEITAVFGQEGWQTTIDAALPDDDDDDKAADADDNEGQSKAERVGSLGTPISALAGYPVQAEPDTSNPALPATEPIGLATSGSELQSLRESAQAQRSGSTPVAQAVGAREDFSSRGSGLQPRQAPPDLSGPLGPEESPSKSPHEAQQSTAQDAGSPERNEGSDSPSPHGTISPKDKPDETSEPPRWVYRDSRGNPTVVTNVRIGLLCR